MGRAYTDPSGFQYQRVTTATTTNVTTGGKRTLLHAIVVNTTAAGTITIQNTAAAVAAVLKASIAEGTYYYDIDMAGLTVITGAASDITIIYTPRA